MGSRLAAAAAALATSCVSGAALAEDFEEGGQLYAIQNRRYTADHEFMLGFGTVPMDAYYKGVTGTFSYTFHFSDLIAWEIVSASYSFNLDTSLRDELETNWGVQPTDFPELKYFGDSNFVFKPLYGKFAVLNDSLVYGELFFVAGPAGALYENAGNFVGGDAGAGLRFYLSEHFAVRFDIRDYYFLLTDNFSDSNNELFLQVALNLNIK